MKANRRTFIKLSKKGYAGLTTQMYFPGQALNKRDRLLQRKGKEDQESMIATKAEGDPETYRFHIVLNKA